MSTKPDVATPPYPRLGEIYNTLAQALDTKSKDRDVERLAREGDFDWSKIYDLRENLILAPLRRYVGDKEFIDKLDLFIQYTHSEYLKIISTISLDSMSRDEALPVLIVHYFAPYALFFLECVWTENAPNPRDLLNPEAHPLEVVFNWADPGGSRALARAAFPEVSDLAQDNREKVTRWANGTQLPDLTSLKLFADALVKNGNDEQKKKAPELLKWLLIVRALTWFERKANPLDLRKILAWNTRQIDERWDLAGTLSQAALKAGEKRKALLEPYKKLMCRLDRLTQKSEGARAEAESSLANFAQQLKKHDPEGLTHYALEWYRGRWHVLSGEYEEALECYRLAVTHSDYRAGATWKQIVTEAMALAGYLGNAKPFLKQLKHRTIASGVIAQPRKDEDVVEDWEIEELRKHFHHLFPPEGRFIEIEQPDEDVGALSLPCFDIELLTNRQPNYRKPDQVVTLRSDDDQVLRKNQLSFYTSLGSIDVVKKLLEKGASVDALDSTGGSALLAAIQKAHDSNERESLDLLLTYPHSTGTLNQQTKIKRLTPLISAIDYGEPDVVAKLLDMGADANLPGHIDNQTPLYLCIRNMGGLNTANSIQQTLNRSLTHDRDPMMRETLRRGRTGTAGVFGDKSLPFDPKNEIFMELINVMTKKYAEKPISNKQLQISKHLLAHGANPNAKHNYPEPGRTPLMLAVENDSPEAVELLMQHGGDPFLRDEAGNDCCAIANMFKSKKVIKHLQKIGVMR